MSEESQHLHRRDENARRAGLLSNASGFVSSLLILLPAVLALLYVRAFGVSVVYFDAWSVVRLFDKWSSGTFSLLDLMDQHNEHRMFFPKGFELLLGWITGYDNVVEMYVIQFCFLATLIILLLAFKDNVRAWLFIFAPVAFLIFSFRQYENMLFGFQINFAFTQTFGVLALFLLYVVGRGRSKKLAFVAALGSGTIATFSTAQGLFVWPAGLLQLFFSPLEKRTKRVLLPLWGLIGLAEWIAYFVDYKRPADRPSLLYVLYHPVVGTEYFLNLLGSSLYWGQTSAFIGGLLLVCLALVSLFLIYRDRRLAEYSFWLSLLLYSSLILASITLGRSGVFGVIQAMASRYTTFSILAVVSIYVMLAKTAFERRSLTSTILLAAMSGIVLLSAAFSYSKGIEVGSKERVSREKAAFVLSTYESQPDEVLAESLNPRARVVRERAPVLQRLGYNVFSEPQNLPPLSALSPISSPTSSGVNISGDGISQQGQTVVVPEEGSAIKLTGWALDDENESVAGGVYVDIDGRLFPAFYGAERQDVADSYGIPSYRYSGFERAIPLSEIGAGIHELSVITLTADKTEYYQPDKKVPLEVR
jgi:hypothetical protein